MPQNYQSPTSPMAGGVNTPATSDWAPAQQVSQLAGQEQQEQEGYGSQEQQGPDIRAFIDSVNIAEELDEKELNDIGYHFSEGFENDLRSCEHWEKE